MIALLIAKLLDDVLLSGSSVNIILLTIYVLTVVPG